MKICRGYLLLLFVSFLLALTASAWAEGASRQVLAFYYGWYGNPASTDHWVHWQSVDAANHHIVNSTDFSPLGAYDSHDPAIVEQQVAMARAAGITGFIASWWGRNSFEDHGVPLLLAAAGKHKFAVSAYYEKMAGDDAVSRIKAAVVDIDYLLTHYCTDKAWLRAGGKPVLFVYGRALHELAPADWQEVIAQVRRDNSGGVVLIADSPIRNSSRSSTGRAPTTSPARYSTNRRRRSPPGHTPPIQKWSRRRGPRAKYRR